MIKVGLTGSIGSGKSFVSGIFEHLQVPVYQADIEARKILNRQEVILDLVDVFGNKILDIEGHIDRKVLASIVFSDPTQLSKLNAIIHPLVKVDFDQWWNAFTTFSYIIVEAAILFESNFHSYLDKIVVVTAPEELCIKRVMKRDSVPYSLVLERMKNQWDASSKAAKADFVLVNDGKLMLLPQVIDLHNKLSGFLIPNR